MKLNKLFVVLSAIALGACVPQRIMEETKGKLDACQSELASLKKTCQENEAKLAELKDLMAKNDKTLARLRQDSASMGDNYHLVSDKYTKLNDINNQLMEKYQKLMAGTEKDNAKLSGELQSIQEQYLKKNDELKALEARLNKQQADLETFAAELKKREARIAELENILKQKEQSTADLRKKLSDALYNFENKGLTITQKNGKVYVSMDESLLFASGKTAVQPKGIEALKNLAKVLEQNTDINVMVEGHTDDIPMKGAGDIKDNWDLSVMRATSVTKILLASASIDGKRITAAGRGEYFPIDPAKTADGRKRNRRTEIILTPKLDELLKVLGNN